jgi:hypothetical protein
MKHRITALAIVGAMMGAFVIAPISAVVAGQTAKNAKKQIVAAIPTSDLLKNREVNGTLSNGGTLQGRLTITKFAFNQTTKQLSVSGALTYGTQSTGSSVTPVTQPFENIPATLTKGTSSKQVGSCDILFLDLGPIFLDVLGLQVDLSQIVLDIDAVSGSGNLLGNLLCQLVSLLDGSGLLTNILQIIEQINAILSSL